MNHSVATLIRLLGVVLLGHTIAAAEDTALSQAAQHVRDVAVHRNAPPGPQEQRATIDRLLASRDPETTANSYLHAIRRHAAKLLSAGQTVQWETLLDARQLQLRRFHDERNVLRGIFFAKAWELPLLGEGERAAAMADLKRWLQVWLDITLQERIAQHHLCRDAWQLLTPTQLAALTRGDWDQYVRKSTGHQRAYFGDRVVAKALGKPDHPEPFATLSTELARKQQAIQDDLLNAERRWRILTFAQPPVSDTILAAEWHRTAAALGAFFLDQVNHIIRLTETGYDRNDPVTRRRIAAQPQRELEELAKKVKSKLTAGADLHALLTSQAE